MSHGTDAWPLAEHLKGLRCAVTVAQTGNTLRAADRLHLAQSSVVRAIQTLEGHLGHALFERHARGMTPLPPGKVVLRRGLRALTALALAERHAPGADADTPWLDSRLAAGLRGRHLRVLLSLVRTGSEKATATALGVSPSAIQQTLAQLEHLAGSPLFDRGRHSLRVTARGEALVRGARLALAELAQAGEDLSAHEGRLRARVAIGALPFSTNLFLPQAIEAVLASQPALEITVIDGTWDALLHQLHHAEIDLIVGALRAPAGHTDIAQETLFDDPLAVIASAQHPLAARARLAWADLAGALWIQPMPNTPAQAIFQQVLHDAGLPPPHPGLQTNSAQVMQAVLARGTRLAMMSPRHVQADIDAGRLAVLPLPVRHAPRAIGLIRRNDYLPSPGAQYVLDAIRDAAAALPAA